MSAGFLINRLIEVSRLWSGLCQPDWLCSPHEVSLIVVVRRLMVFSAMLVVIPGSSGCLYSFPVEEDQFLADTEPDSGSSTESVTEPDSSSDTAEDSAVETDTAEDGCPSGVEFPSSPSLSDLVSPGTAAEFTDNCPGHQFVIGFQGFVDQSGDVTKIGRIQTLCGAGAISRIDGECVVVTSVGASLPLRGTDGELQFQRVCPANQVVVGFDAKYGNDIDQLTFWCAPILVTEEGGGYRLTMGDVTKLSETGGSGGAHLLDAPCPTEWLATGSYVEADTFVRTFGLVCREPSLSI